MTFWRRKHATSSEPVRNLHRTVFAHPGMCNVNVGHEGDYRVVHVTLYLRFGPQATIKQITEINDLRSGQHRSIDGQGPMGDCLEWLNDRPDELEKLFM